MLWLKLIARYALVHKLRLTLTLVGVMAAVAALGLLGAVVTAWEGGTDVHAAARLVTHHGGSLASTLPIGYREPIRRVDGVAAVAHAHWFNGSFRDGRDFFPKFAIDASSYFDVYPELKLDAVQREAFLADRSGAVLGRKLAAHFALAPGDVVTLRAAKYGGLWRFTVRGVFDAPSPQQEWQMLFHWALLDATVRARAPSAGDRVGAYVVRVHDAADAQAVAQRIDRLFRHAPDATSTESENAFLLGFFYSTEAILGIVAALSILVTLSLLLVLANTMLMSARERYRDYATFKALGFGPVFIGGLIVGESLLIALCGGALGLLATSPLLACFESLSGGLLPVLVRSPGMVIAQLLAAICVGTVGGALPSLMVSRRSVVDSLRAVA